MKKYVYIISSTVVKKKLEIDVIQHSFRDNLKMNRLYCNLCFCATVTQHFNIGKHQSLR